MRFPIRRRGAEAGFTLVEVMIAMVILAVGLLTIGLAQLTALRMTTRSKNMSQAMYLAQEQIEAFLAAPPAAGGTFQDPNNPIDVEVADRDLTTFNRSWTIVTGVPRPSMSTVSVQVTWNAGEGGLGAMPARQTVTLQGVVGP